MSYPFRVTFRQDADTYIEDRGFPHVVRRGDADFAVLDAEFSPFLAIGQSAQKSQDNGEWEILDGFPLLLAMKSIHLERLNVAWLQAESRGAVDGGAGFLIDANERANRDIEGLITSLEAAGEEKATFCAADNSFHEVTLEQLRAMRLAIIAHGQRLYARKWKLRQAILAAKTPDELEAINIDFTEAA